MPTSMLKMPIAISRAALFLRLSGGHLSASANRKKEYDIHALCEDGIPGDGTWLQLLGRIDHTGDPNKVLLALFRMIITINKHRSPLR